MTTINERIAALRREHAMTQEQLASIIGVSAQSISKWENSVTTPDIQLLPVLAGVFDVSIDELFSEQKPQRTYPMDDAPEECYRAVLEAIQRCRLFEDDDFASPRNADVRSLPFTVIPRTGGGVYVNHDLALVYRPDVENALPLLDDEAAANMLRAFASPAFRRILKWQLSNRRAYTASSVAAQCGLTEQETQEALRDLTALKFTVCSEVETGAETLRIYSACGGHMIPILVLPMLSLAKRMASMIP